MTILVLAASLFSSSPVHKPRLDLRLPPPVSTGVVHLFQRAEKQIVRLAEDAQHLGSRRKDVWVTPILGSTTGAEVRFDIR